MKVSELVDLIAIRDFAFRASDDVNIKIDHANLRPLRNKIKKLDELIVSGLLNLDLGEPVPPPANIIDVKGSAEQPAQTGKRNATFKRSTEVNQ